MKKKIIQVKGTKKEGRVASLILDKIIEFKAFGCVLCGGYLVTRRNTLGQTDRLFARPVWSISEYLERFGWSEPVPELVGSIYSFYFVVMCLGGTA